MKFLEMLFNHLKLSMYRLKIILFGGYLLVVAYNYFVKIEKKDNGWNFSLEPSNIPLSAILSIAIVIIFLILADILHNSLRAKKLMTIIKDENMPLQLREKALDAMSNIK